VLRKSDLQASVPRLTLLTDRFRGFTQYYTGKSQIIPYATLSSFYLFPNSLFSKNLIAGRCIIGDIKNIFT